MSYEVYALINKLRKVFLGVTDFLSKKHYHAGFDQLVNISSGVVGYFLQQAHICFDAPDEYYINGMNVSQGTYAATDIGDILRMYGVQGCGIYLIILQKRKDLIKEYEIKSLR